MTAPHLAGPHAGYRRLVHEVTETVALPHTYTLLIWCTTMAAASHHGIPDVVSILAMLVGACAAYVVVGAVVHGRRGPRPAGRRRAIAHPYLAACGNIVTLVAATGVCELISRAAGGHLVWLLVGLAGTTVYVVGMAAQAWIVARLVPGRA